ncbi:hypothetical protein J3U21_02305 [Gilliamella sp. B2776]|uniref:hypothetical protein n=1 Tax=unclassified Gilliamella TaxID=2685620 RepID=UPI00226AB4F1|nr:MULTISPECIES: hypothetical protein [unclassified Gilliamella]MCX8649166.1 hypothetical protein [Gilliamella sp. B2779]MCX8652958.1 hypothetical protein [Gilliamella sp. B2737]MCX8690978.1 hypothetical protein [Gilliamella sp. B2776]MCX8702136.1 hypothetical protein [Gilliamella sp. B2781]WDM18187.1 hypothetical protein J4T76_08780 [Gilliamella sp. B3022]
MHIYRSINKIKAITFDLDDTLYDNSDIVEKSEEEIVKYLQRYEGLHHLTVSELHLEKKRCRLRNERFITMLWPGEWKLLNHC